MIAVTAATFALVMDEALRDAVVVLQAAKDPEWKWWLTLAASVLGPLFSTAGSIYVAWRVFRWQGLKDREGWILDQEKLEWSNVLSRLTVVDTSLPHVFANVDWSTMPEGLLQDLRNVIPPMRNAIFIARALDKEGLIKDYVSFVSEAAASIWEIKDLNAMIENPAVPQSPEDASRLTKIRLGYMNTRVEIYGKLRDGFHAQASRIRKIAQTLMVPERAAVGTLDSQQVEAVEDVGQSAAGGGE